jgi:hypothetical protein
MQDWNPFAQVSQSFAQGQQSAQGYAEMALNIDKLKKEQEYRKATLQQAAEVHEFNRGSWAMETIGKAIDMTAGPGQNAYIKATLAEFERLGIPNSGMLEGLVKDPEFVAQYRQLMTTIADADPETRKEIFMKAPKALGDKEMFEHTKNLQNHLMELAKQRQAKDLEARNKVQEQGRPDAKLKLDYLDKANKFLGGFEKEDKASAQIDALARKTGTLDFDAMNGADDAAFIKAFSQYNDTQAVRDGDIALITGTSALLNRALEFVSSGIINDKTFKLTPEVRRDFYYASRTLQKASNAFYLDKLEPLKAQLESANVPLSEVFGERQLKLINRKKLQREMQEKGDKKGEGGEADSERNTNSALGASMKPQPPKDPTLSINNFINPAPGAVGPQTTKPKLTAERAAQYRKDTPEKLRRVFAIAKQKKMSRAQVLEKLPNVSLEALEAWGIK